MEQIITWKDFVKRKDRTRREVIERAAERVEQGYASKDTFDLDMLPVVSTWDRIPFSFTTQSCSGTPREHMYKSSGYSEVNELEKNANAIIYAHSYMKHPLFHKFRNFLTESILSKTEGTLSRVHGAEEQKNLYLHMVEIFVPEEVKEAGDLEYLTRFWKGFNSDLKSFSKQQLASNDWFWEEK